jgi:hypothetical protein
VSVAEPSGLVSDEKIAGERKFEATRVTVSMQLRDRWLRQTFESVNGLRLKMFARSSLVARYRFKVMTGAKRLPRPRQYHALDRTIFGNLVEMLA